MWKNPVIIKDGGFTGRVVKNYEQSAARIKIIRKRRE